MSTGSHELEVFKLPDGGEVKTGLLLPQAGEVMPMMGEYPDNLLLDDKDIQKLLPDGYYLQERKRFGKWMINQSRIGKCNTSANVGGYYQLMDNAGMKHEALADNHLYWRCNGGSDSGSSLISTYKIIQSGGVCRRTIDVNGQPYRIPDLVYNKRQLPAGVAEAADRDGKLFVAFEAYMVPKQYDKFVRVVASALARRQPIVWAWHVGSGGMRLSNGYMNCGNGPGNHATLLQSAKWVGGQDLVHPDNRNSWGPSQDPLYGPLGSGWGEGGFGLVTMQDAFRCIRYHDFYVMTTVKHRPDQPIVR